MDLPAQQLLIARRFGAAPLYPAPGSRVGVARNVEGETVAPINGLRHQPVGATSGWYIWAGELLSDDDDFFESLCVEHLESWAPSVLPYLALPPGFRFLLAPSYEDVWFDEALLRAE